MMLVGEDDFPEVELRLPKRPVLPGLLPVLVVQVLVAAGAYFVLGSEADCYSANYSKAVEVELLLGFLVVVTIRWRPPVSVVLESPKVAVVLVLSRGRVVLHPVGRVVLRLWLFWRRVLVPWLFVRTLLRPGG